MSGIIAQNVGRHTGLVKASSGGGGAWTLISTQTASASSTISFTSGLDSTYDEYIFKFYNLHPSADQPHLQFQGNASGGSGYNETINSIFFESYHAESDGEAVLEYTAGGDLANGTGFQRLFTEANYSNDGSISGSLHLFAPSDTTFVKQFMSVCQGMFGPTTNPYSWQSFGSGYFNTTSAIDEIQFKFSSGNIDAGDISLFGIG